MALGSPLPPRYAYLRDLASPKMLLEALPLYGTRETAGPANNPTILGWAKEVELAGSYTDDSAIPWCGLFAAVVAKRAGYQPPAGPLWALNWSRFGQLSPTPGIGDVLVFMRLTDAGMAGHVGLYVGEDSDAFHVLGGNQGDAVSITRVPRARLHAARQPLWRVARPAGAVPHRLPVEGGATATLA